MVYEARFGFGWRGALLVLVCAVFVFVSLLPGVMPLVLQILSLALFGGGGLVMVVTMASRKVALRVDDKGVLLGGSPLRYRASTAFVPWDEISEVVLWKQRLPRGMTMRYVGVRRRPDLPPLSGPGSGPIGRELSEAVVGHVPPDVVMTSRAVNGWRLDEDALAAAVQAYGGGKPITELD